MGCVTPTTEPLPFRWTALGGVLATTPTRGTDRFLSLPPDTPAGAGLLVGLGVVSAPIAIGGGLVLLAGGALAHGLERYSADQTVTEAVVGGPLDVSGISGMTGGAC